MSTWQGNVLRGNRASQPAAASVVVGCLYAVTDEGNIVERSTGAAWEAYSPDAGGGDVTASGPLTAGAVLVGGGTTVAAATSTAAGMVTFLGTPSSANLAAALTDETGSGAAVFGTSPTITTPTISGAIALPDNVRQTFNPGADAAGLNVGAVASDPGTPSNGDLWYHSGDDELRARIGGATVALGAGGGGALVLLEQHTASASASLDFETWYDAAYDTYLIEIVALVVATDNVNIILRMSTDGGATYDSGNNYAWAANQVATNAFNAGVGSAADSSIQLARAVDNAATNGVIGHYTLANPASTASYKGLTGQSFMLQNDANFYVMNGGGLYLSTTAVNAFQILASSGNLASGTVRVYGIAAS
jgi:hypothetical protein